MNVINKTVLVVGSVAFDDVETPFGKRTDSLGGSAIYFALAAAHFTDVRIIGVAGEDFPQSAKQLLENRKIDIRGLEFAPGKTFRWGGCYHKDINIRDTLYTHLNVFENFRPQIPEIFRTTPNVFLGNIQPALQLDVLSNMDYPAFVALDTMNLWIDIALKDLMQVIRKVNLLLLNDTELQALSGEMNLSRGLRKLHALGIPYLIIKRGEHGAYLSNGNSLFFVPAYPIEYPVDPTGAGDSFAGGVIGYLASRDSTRFRELKKAMVYGAVLGSICVEDFSVDALIRTDRDTIESRFYTLRQIVSL
jgi:sugar/nucleoside kinase (ribokinase family)